jgi:hypothetical protein
MSFDRSRLPDADTYFDGEGFKLAGPGKWKTTRCDFHGGSDSMRVHLERGAWVCMSCGAKGGDVLAFHMQRHGLEFVDAAKALGAWSESDKPTKHPHKPMPFTARDGLTVLVTEANLAAVAACNMARGIAITEADRTRLLQAAQRIAFIAGEAR